MQDLRSRCRELLIDRATYDLTPEGERELRQILSTHPDWEADEAMEETVATLHLALLGELENTPPDVLQRLHDRAGRWRPPQI
jgi:hypothetical protein